ncbi:MAG: ABC transporter permease [Spirochaetes bacterium GWB1_59_5]|nr:MAG: ABC transporter permease [Spirochaetes bacterium GWB1_59_5]
MWKVLMMSLTPVDLPRDRSFGLLIAPWDWKFDAYAQFLGSPHFLRAAMNSFMILVSGVATSLFLTIPMAYVLSVKALPGRMLLSTFVLIPFLFDPGLIPTYLVVTNTVGLSNKLSSVYLPAAISVYNVFVMKNFFEGLPLELREAARIDGASELQILLRIVMPLSKPIILTIGLFYGVHFWNDFFTAMVYINDPKLLPLPVLLRNILNAANFNEYVEMDAFSSASIYSLKAASVLLAALPMVVIYPFIQRYFTKGTLAGGIKG